MAEVGGELRGASSFESVVLALLLGWLFACAELPITLQNPKAKKLLEANPITQIAPNRTVPDDCEFLRTIYAGPGIGVEREQELVLRGGALIGATHVQWQDQETAHFYRCPQVEAEGEAAFRSEATHLLH